MLCHPGIVLLVHLLMLSLRLLLVCKVLLRLMLLLMVHHPQLQMLRRRTILLTSPLNNPLGFMLLHFVTLLLHLMTLLLHHMAVLMQRHLFLFRSPRGHKLAIFMVMLWMPLLLTRNLRTNFVVQRPVPPNSNRGFCQLWCCNSLLLKMLPRWPNFG